MIDKYADYAVDRVLLYFSYLSKDCNVMAIAVSGEPKKELKNITLFTIKRCLCSKGYTSSTR